MTNLYKKATAVATTLLLSLFLLPACSDNEGGGPDIPEARFAKVVIALHSLDNSTPAYTKAVYEDGNIVSDITNPDSADTQYEHHIDTWWIAILKKGEGNNYQFDHLISNDPIANNNHENSETPVEIELLIGETYKFYAFANLDGLANGEDVKSWLNELSSTTTDNEIQQKAVALKELGAYHGGTNTDYIPMSSYGYTATIAENNQPISIPLIRLLGKVKIDVTNAFAREVKITKLSMGKFRTQGDIFLLPYDVASENGNLLVSGSGGEHKLLNPLFPSSSTEVKARDWSLDTNSGANTTIAQNATESYEFYINETAQENQENNGGDMTISVEIEGIEKDPTRNTDFFFIRRNDLLRIPVLISNAQTTLKLAQSQMPIGGIPPTLTFNAGIDISNKTVDLDRAGKVTIFYQLEKVSEEGNWTLVYAPVEGATVGEQYCNAQLINADLDGDGHHLILEPTDDEKVQLNWLGAGEWGYKLQETSDLKTGRFDINVQELASGTATVKLTLVATNGTSTTVLPYTLTIRYGKATQNNTEGGNS